MATAERTRVELPQWLVLQLATPVVVWGAWPFHRAGTVTTGSMSLVDVAVESVDREEALRLAGAVEDASEHLIAGAIAAAAREKRSVVGNALRLRRFRALREEGEL